MDFMMGAAVVILTVLLCICVVALLLKQKNIDSAEEQLRRINVTHTNGRVQLTSPDRGLERLYIQINAVLDARQAADADYRKKERQLRGQIANISHDLRTPLTAIRGYLQLLHDPNCTSEERNSYLQIIEKRSEALQTLITNFYDLSRVESGEYQTTLGPVDLYAVLCELIAGFCNAFSEQDLEVHPDLEEDLPMVIADKDAVVRIFSNLLQNALQHAQGALSIRQYRQANIVVTQFSNPVTGLTQQDMEHIFDRFYMADRVRSGQNTGLGLCIVKKLVEHMGHIVNATLDEGNFCITIQWNTAPKA